MHKNLLRILLLFIFFVGRKYISWNFFFLFFLANSPKSSQMVRKMSSRVEDEEDIIDVDVSDDEKYNANNVFQGLWIPYPDQVAEMFEKLDNGGLPVLKWKCPGRRPPEVEKEDEDMDIEQKLVVEQKIEEHKEEKK